MHAKNQKLILKYSTSSNVHLSLWSSAEWQVYDKLQHAALHYASRCANVHTPH